MQVFKQYRVGVVLGRRKVLGGESLIFYAKSPFVRVHRSTGKYKVVNRAYYYPVAKGHVFGRNKLGNGAVPTYQKVRGFLYRRVFKGGNAGSLVSLGNVYDALIRGHSSAHSKVTGWNVYPLDAWGYWGGVW